MIIPPRKSALIAPLMIKPPIAAGRLLFRMTPTKLTMNAAGVVVTMVSPPRALIGDPHPGWRRSMLAIVAGAANDRAKPIRPMIPVGETGFNIRSVGYN
jgi:hypothetical protein